MRARNLPRNLNEFLKCSSTSFYSSLQSSVTDTLVSEVYFSEEDVVVAIHELNPRKYDAGGVCTEHLKFASSVISESLATFFTSAVRHGYMPGCIRDCVTTPILKGNKDPSCSQNYRPIALASSQSKILERLILHKYSTYFISIL